MEGSTRCVVFFPALQDTNEFHFGSVASDIVNLQPSWTRSGTSSLKDCALVLETRLASYRIESFSSNYADDFKSSAAVFVSAFAFAVLNGVRPSSTTEDLRAKLEAKLVREDNSLMPANAVLPAYRLQGFLGSFLPSISSAVLKLLNTLLPNPTLSVLFLSFSSRFTDNFPTQHHAACLRGTIRAQFPNVELTTISPRSSCEVESTCSGTYERRLVSTRRRRSKGSTPRRRIWCVCWERN